MRKRTHDDFLELVEEKGNGEYTVLGRYVDAKTKVFMKHVKCGHRWESSPDGFINKGARCPECGYRSMRSKQRKSNEQFTKEVSELVGDDYRFLEDYANNTTKLRVIHVACGWEYIVTPRDFLSGRRCPNCKGKRISNSVSLDPEIFSEYFNSEVGNEYTLLEPYKKTTDKVTVRHNKCGRVYRVAPIKFIGGNRCSVCVFKDMGVKMRSTHKEFLDRVEKLSSGEIEVLGEYTGRRVKIEFLHIKCGTVWTTVPDVILRGGGCPHCCSSSMEKEISSFLKSTGIEHESQYRIEGCRNVLPLPFDFAVFNKNSELIFLIECDGIQHFKPIDFFGGEEALLKTKENDSIKSSYCIENGIPLISIPYNENINLYKTIIERTHADLEPSTQEIV